MPAIAPPDKFGFGSGSGSGVKGTPVGDVVEDEEAGLAEDDALGVKIEPVNVVNASMESTTSRICGA